jgi:hypothetical protein
MATEVSRVGHAFDGFQPSFDFRAVVKQFSLNRRTDINSTWKHVDGIVFVGTLTAWLRNPNGPQRVAPQNHPQIPKVGIYRFESKKPSEKLSPRPQI